MNKEQYIKYWIESAKKDLNSMNILFKNKQYVHSLFFAHLYLEKIAKALWVKNNQANIPPKIHNLITLLNQANIELPEDSITLLTILNKYHLNARYPEEIAMLYKATKKNVCLYYINELIKFKKWLLKKHL